MRMTSGKYWPVGAVFDQHVKDWLQHVENKKQQRTWCLCGRKIEHERWCWVRRALAHKNSVWR